MYVSVWTCVHTHVCAYVCVHVDRYEDQKGRKISCSYS